MLHPHTELRFINHQMGYGVFAVAPIPKGTVTWIRDPLDQVISRDQAQTLPRLSQAVLYKYGYLDERGDIVLCWDLAKFINHSCFPNCLTGSGFEIAIRDIAPDEELTDDYARLHLVQPFTCDCGRANCRQQIRPDDPLRLNPLWSEQLKHALELVSKVDQPLTELFPIELQPLMLG